jgi:hypothetical protein
VSDGIDKTALSYWFPKLVEAGLPVPRTKIIKMSLEAQKVIWGWFDGEDAHTGDEEAFFEELRLATLDIGFPCFLRTDHTSGKHAWEDTCFVESFSNLKQHVFNIAEFSEIADMIGMPWDTWVVREFLPTIPVGVCPRYGNMPVCREFRYFIEDGRYFPGGATATTRQISALPATPKTLAS